MSRVYIHSLEDNKYFVGTTTNPDVKIGNTLCGSCMESEFVRLYKPVHIIDIIEDCDKYDFDKCVISTMKKYGISNVRGGDYINLELSKDQLDIISGLIDGTFTQFDEYKRDLMSFTLEEYHNRLDNVVNEMNSRNIDVLVSSRPENMYYLSNYQTVGNPVQVLLVSRDGDMLIITRELEVTNAMYKAISKYAHYDEGQDPIEVIVDHIGKYINHYREHPGYHNDDCNYPINIGFEYNSDRMTYDNQSRLQDLLLTKHDKHRFVDCSTLISQFKVVKSDAEIECSKKAASFVNAGINKAVSRAKSGMTEVQIAGLINCEMMRLGGEYTSYPCFVSAGYTGCMGHHTAEQKVIKDGELLFMEIGGCYKRYHAAKMHTIYVGSNKPLWFTEAERILKNNIVSIREEIVPGRKACDIDKIMRKNISAYSYPHEQAERSGYSIGIGFFTDWNENDVFKIDPYCENTLKENMVLHLIPWIRVPEKGAIGFSDTVKVTNTGAVSLFKNKLKSSYENTVRYILKNRDKKSVSLVAKDLVDYMGSQKDHVVSYHKSMDIYEPTRLVSKNMKDYGINNLYIKDEGTRMGQKAFKILGVSYAMHRLMEHGVLKEGDTVTTMTDGNHGSALASLAKMYGYNAVIYVPENMTLERINTIRSYGAKCIVTNGSYDDCIEMVKEESQKNGWILISDTAWENYVDIPKNIGSGYLTIFNEVYEELKGSQNITHIFLQVGVGGFASAGVAYAVSQLLPEDRPKLICVEPEDADCVLENVKAMSILGNIMCKGKTDSIMSGLNCGVPSSLAWPILRDYIDAYVAIGDEWARKAVRMLYHGPNNASEDRVYSGESGAAGLAGLLACLETPELKHHLDLNEHSNVLVINTEGVTDKKSFNEIIRYDVFD